MRPEDMIGEFFSGVELETCRDIDLTRPRVRALGEFDPNIRVEFPRDLRERFPIGTRYQATVKVCQKTSNGRLKGPPYLKAYDIALIPESVPDEGLLARVREGSISGLAYHYVWKTKS